MISNNLKEKYKENKLKLIKEGIKFAFPISMFLGLSTLIYLAIMWGFFHENRDIFFSSLPIWLGFEFIILGIFQFRNKEFIRRSNIIWFGKPKEFLIKISPIILIVMGSFINLFGWLHLILKLT